MIDWLPASPLVLAIGFVITAVAAALQGTIGFGFAVLSVPVLSLIDPVMAPVPQLLITGPLTLAMAWRERRHLALKGVGWVLLGRLPGAGLGVLLLKLATPLTLDLILAGMVLGAVGLVALGASVKRTAATEFGAGVASGTMSLVSSIGGPPLAILFRESKGATLRASLAVIFSVGLLITITTRAVAGEISETDLKVAAVLVPAMFVGFRISTKLAGKVEGAPLRRAILVVATVAAVGLVVRAMGR